MNKDIKTIDCFGDICPIPILKIEQALAEAEVGESFMIVVAHSCTIQAITDKYLDKKHDVKIEEVMNGVWEATFTKK